MDATEEAKTHTIHYEVDAEPQETASHELTPRQIIVNAGLNPDERYLVEIKGHHQDSFQGRMDEPLRVHEGEKFITVFTGPVPVSYHG